ncbi:MAG: DUF1385 domain-containing protein [Janthinobacterium lividum]
MENEVLPVQKPVVETSLHSMLEALHLSGQLSMPLHDPETGRVVAILSRPDTLPSVAPPRLGGMATPLGVYLHDGVSSGGAGFWGLVLTGMTMSCLALLAQASAHDLSHIVSRHVPMLDLWENHLPYGLALWLSAISPWLPLPFVFLLLRLVPLSGIHAAEHQVVHCVERREPLVPGRVRAMPRVHPRCGTNLFAGFTLFLLTFLAVFCTTEAARWQLLDSVTLAAIVAGPFTLIYWRRIGGWVQQWFATRPATDSQIAGAIHAAEQVLSRHQRRMERGGRLRFMPLRRAWTMGIGQILLGYAAVVAVLTVLELVWPGLSHWLE